MSNEAHSYCSPLDINPSKNLSHRRQLYETNAGVFVVPGAKNAAVCDTNTGNVYSANQSAVDVFLGQSSNEEFFTQIIQKRLRGKENVGLVKKEKPHFDLEFVWFEIISDDCNERCVHCYADSMPPTYRKVIGLDEIPIIENSHGLGKISADKWKGLIDESASLGAKSCQFIGGEPFLWKGESGESVLDLAKHAKEQGFETIEIFTNATLIRENDIRRIKELGLNIAVSLYSDVEDVHDSITRTPGSYRKTTKSLERLREEGITARVETVLMRQNEDTVESTNQFITQMGFSHRPPDVLRPKGRGDNPGLSPSDEALVRNGLMLGPSFSAESSFFTRSVEGHNCLAGKITITDNGDVLPCIFSRGKVMGNVLKENSLETILKGDIEDVWETTKDDVLVCQDCEYRYVCFDCRPISEGASEGKGDYKTAPYPRCTYNPYKGEWGGGTWKLDDAGKPFYDESLKALIDNARTLQVPLIQSRGHS